MVRLARLTLTVAFALLGLSCAEDEPPSLIGEVFSSPCDDAATIEFVDATTVTVQVNFCEGYTPETWNYSFASSDELVLERGNDRVTFTVEADGSSMTQTSDNWFTCNNCMAGAVWQPQ